MSTIGGQPIQRIELRRPRWGSAWARVETAGDSVPVGPAKLVVGDLTLKGSVLPGRAGEDAPSSWVGIWVNGAAWDTILPARPTYQSDDGVQLKTILADLVRDCGSPPIELPPSVAIGQWWYRMLLGPDRRPRTGREELAELYRGGYLPGPWWIDDDETMRFGGRSPGPVTADARVLGRSYERGKRRLGVDSPAAFAPGATFEGATIETVVIFEHAEELQLETWTS